jgi:predicted deacylase
MTFTHSRISPEIDLDAEGKHQGFLRIPHSVHRSAYGWLPMPIVSIRNGEGPRVLLLSGNHGDEYEGQIALSRLSRTLTPDNVRGHVVIVPMANFPAAKAGLRTSPIDQGNLNRSFPGGRDGTVTQTIAHMLEEELMAQADLVIDLHSGGSSLLYLPAIQVKLDLNGVLEPREKSLADAYAAPHTHVLHSTPLDNQASSGVRRKGALYLGAEFAGSGTVTPQALRICEQGLARALLHFGTLKRLPDGVDAAGLTRYLETKSEVHYVYASEPGVFEPLVELGDEVSAGGEAAAVHFPERPWREPVLEHFEADGMVVCKRIPGRCEPGDCLMHLASDWTP